MGLLPRRYAEILATLKRLPARLRDLERNLDTLLLQSFPGVGAPVDLPLGEREFRRYSQNGEDGILLWLFSTIGAVDRRFVEFGAGDGRECNTANLSLNFGWSGLLMDGSDEKVAAGRRHYDAHLGARAQDVRFRQAFVTAENINDLLKREGMTGEIDLLSVDIDGNDYWVWKAIDAVHPRVVVVEYNAGYGPEAALTIPYDPGFRIAARSPERGYHGASLAAFAKLGDSKGYDLAGCDSSGVNAFFVRRDAARGRIRGLRASEAWKPGARNARKGRSWEEQFAYLKTRPLAEV